MDTIATPPVFQLGELAFSCSNEREARHRTVAVFKVTEDGPRKVGDLRGEFVTSYYLSTLQARSSRAEAADDFVLHGREHAVKAEDWPVLSTWIADMTRWAA